MSKSLSESAAEILSASLGKASKESMNKSPDDGQDIGGPTTENPAGVANPGAKAAAPISAVAKPAAKGDAKSVKVASMAEEEEMTEEELEQFLDSLSEEELNGLLEELEHDDEDELDELLNSLSEEELNELLEDLESDDEDDLEQIDEALGNDIRKHVNAVKSGDKEEASKILDRIYKKHGAAAVKHTKTYTNRELKEAEQIDEISKGAAIRAAGVAGSMDDSRTNRIIDRIHKKFGSKASDDAAAHASAQYYGRDGKSRGTDPLNSVLDRPANRRITKAGKLNKQDQKELASVIKGRMKMHGGKYQRKKPIPEEFEQIVDLPELSEEEILEARKAKMKGMVDSSMGSCKEDVDALFNGESLSEEFRNKATTIFEAAVRARVETIITTIAEENEKAVTAEIEEIQAALSEQVDEYLNYVVEQWMQENELAIETGLRAEIAEDFINGLKNLFMEHYIEVPEEKADLVEEMAARVVESEELLEAMVQELDSLTVALNESKAVEILRRTCEGLTEMQVQKIKSLAEGVEFTTEGDYTEKLAVIRESYFPSKIVRTAAPQTVVETQEDHGVSNIMDAYVQAITKTLPK